MNNKKPILVLLLSLLTIVSYSQSIIEIVENNIVSNNPPFEHILNMSKQELLISGFKYSEMKNCYILKSDLNEKDGNAFDIYIYMEDVERAKMNIKWTRMLNIIALIKEINRVKKENKIRMANSEKAIVQICFYDLSVYKSIMGWVNKRVNNPLLVCVNKSELMEFNYRNYKIRLSKTQKKVSNHLLDDKSVAAINSISNISFITPIYNEKLTSKKGYFPIYFYTVFIDEKLTPEWLFKKQKKHIGDKNRIENLSKIL